MDHTALAKRLQRALDAVVSKNKDVFSAILGVAGAPGDFSWAGAAGLAYAGTRDLMTVDTPIFIASITKMYTSAATMILQERGKLSLDDPISKFLPHSILAGLHRYKGHDYSNQLRIYHLLSQTSGLPDYFLERPRGGQSLFDRIVANGDEEWDVAEVADLAKNSLSPKFPPEAKEQEMSGKTAHYSDTNYQLLGAVIESAAQKPLHEILTELIIDPLELASTYLHGRGGPRETLTAPPATIYYRTRPLHLDKAMTSFGPDGGMVATIGDSLKFLRNLIEGTLFTYPAILERIQCWKRIFFPFEYGLGLMRFKLPRIFSPFAPPPELIGHSGASSAFLFHSDVGQLYLGGTLNQLAHQSRPFRLMLKIIKMIDSEG